MTRRRVASRITQQHGKEPAELGASLGAARKRVASRTTRKGLNGMGRQRLWNDTETRCFARHTAAWKEKEKEEGMLKGMVDPQNQHESALLRAPVERTRKRRWNRKQKGMEEREERAEGEVNVRSGSGKKEK